MRKPFIIIIALIILNSGCAFLEPSAQDRERYKQQEQAIRESHLSDDQRLLTCKETCAPKSVKKSYVSSFDDRLVCECSQTPNE